MSHTNKRVFFPRLISISLFFAVFGLFGVDLGTTPSAQAQKSRTKAATSFTESATQQPLFGNYKGVTIGMTTEEARRKLGQPTQSVEDQDFYVISETETVQIVYDAAHKVTAISIDYVGDKGAPEYRAVVGADIQTKPDGSMYKMVRYDQLGYWVSYNRTSGVVPIITITIQKNR